MRWGKCSGDAFPPFAISKGFLKVADGEVIDWSARGMANEAVSALRSHEALNNLQFKNMENQYEEIKTLVAGTNKKIDDLAANYDQKFWSLAVTIIVLLIGGIGALVFKIMFPH